MSMLADPPPEIVREPKDIQYITGDKLGNGGFAICYRGELCQKNKPTGKIVALKIVKSQMDRRVIQKVCVSTMSMTSSANQAVDSL
jgi:myosin-1